MFFAGEHLEYFHIRDVHLRLTKEICDTFLAFHVMPPSHRMRGATAVLAPPTTVKTADVRGSTAETFNMFGRASVVLPPSHRRRGATAVLVRHQPQWHRHDRRGSAVIPSLIAVEPPKTVKTADLRGGTAETLTYSKLPQCYRGLG